MLFTNISFKMLEFEVWLSPSKKNYFICFNTSFGHVEKAI